MHSSFYKGQRRYLHWRQMYQRKRKRANKRDGTEEYNKHIVLEPIRLRVQSSTHSENLKGIIFPQHWSVTDSEASDSLKKAMGCPGEC